MRFLIVIVVMGALVAFLHARFPYILKSDGDMARVSYMVGIIGLIAAGTWATGRYRFSDIVKYSLTWLAIILGLVLVYTYRDQLQWKRIQAELFPNQIRVSGDGGLSVQASADGHFHIEAEVNGAWIDFMVDTGASDIVLSPSDAQRAGYMLDMLEYTRLYNTANGTGAGAPVTINTFKVGYAVFQHIPASVNNAAMDTSLLGMSFLRQFKSYRVDGDVLTLLP
jgi:aspartyl protease family protein